MAHKMGRRVWVMAAFAAVTLGGLATAGAVMLPLQDGAEVRSAMHPAQPVRVSRITFAPAERVMTYTGTIRPRHEVAMGFRVAGKIVSRSVEVGDRILPGQELARLDDADAALQAELAEAEDAAARVDHRRARAEMERSRRLFSEGHIAQAALDRAVSSEAEAAARVERAARSLALARNGLSYMRLLADADGVVTATPGEAGQVVAAGTPVVAVAQGGTVDVVFALPETDRGLLLEGRAQATLWGEEGGAHPLILRDIAPDVDPAGRTYRVRMALEAPEADFGRTVTVTVSAGAGAPVAEVPLASVLNDGAGPGVWRVRGDRVERVAVEVASVTGEVAAIRGALMAGEVIVSLGAHKVDPARPVRVVETADAAGG